MIGVEQVALGEPVKSSIFRLDEVSKIIQGGRMKLSGKDFVESGYPGYGAGGLNGFVEIAEFSEEAVILSSIGARCGKCFYVDGEWTSLANTQLIFPDRSLVDPKFLWYQLNDELSWHRSGTGQPFIKPSDVKARSVNIPPLPEQRRIAAILDKADHLRTQRREALAHLDALKHSIFNDMFGNPVINDRGFAALPLPEIGHLYSGGTPSKANPELWNGNIPWFSPKDIKSTHLSDSIDHVSAQVPLETSLRLLPEKTIVFVVRGMILAHSFPAAMLKIEATINQDLKAIRLNMPFDPEFLLACLLSQKQHALSLVETAAHGTKKLNAEALSQIQILNPPLELQQTFARRVATIERLKEQHRTQLAELDTLFASLQHRAFRGEL